MKCYVLCYICVIYIKSYLYCISSLEEFYIAKTKSRNQTLYKHRSFTIIIKLGTFVKRKGEKNVDINKSVKTTQKINLGFFQET